MTTERKKEKNSIWKVRRNIPLDREALAEVRKEYYNVTRRQATDNLYHVLQGSINISYIYKYYFEKVANDTLYYASKYSVNEALNDDYVLQTIINMVRHYRGFYATGSLTNKFRKCTQVGDSKIAYAPTNFPYKECLRILRTYCPDKGVYIDPSCGWGVRLLAAAYLGLHYIGFDVNDKLVARLNYLKEDIQRYKKFKCHVFLKGSEIFNKKLVGKGDLVFTSPPYFGLEDYRNGKGQSYKKGQTLEQWNKTFLYPMMSNMYKYLKPGRYCLINIKDYKRIPLVQSTIDAGIEAGFRHTGTETLTNIQRINERKELVDNSEDILVFFKPGKNPFEPRVEREDDTPQPIKMKKLFE